MKVIKKSYETQVTCSKCGAVLIYDSSDIYVGCDMEGNFLCCVTCPDCNHNIDVWNTIRNSV